jgi:hypothetical protein
MFLMVLGLLALAGSVTLEIAKRTTQRQ